MPRAKGRSVMFACRLNEGEAKALESLLAIAESESIRSEQFRSILLELEGNLERDAYGHLIYHDRESERLINLNASKERDKQLKDIQAWNTKLNSLR